MGWFELIATDLTSVKFTAIVNLLSVIGFAITVWVMFGVRQIKAQYTSRIRIPELKNKLSDGASQLGEYLNDYENNRNAIAIEIEKIEPVLKAIKKRLGWSETGKIKEALKELKLCQKNGAQNVDQVRKIYNTLYGISAELEQWENDKKWS